MTGSHTSSDEPMFWLYKQQ